MKIAAKMIAGLMLALVFVSGIYCAPVTTVSAAELISDNTVGISLLSESVAEFNEEEGESVQPSDIDTPEEDLGEKTPVDATSAPKVDRGWVIAAAILMSIVILVGVGLAVYLVVWNKRDRSSGAQNTKVQYAKAQNTKAQNTKAQDTKEKIIYLDRE